MDDHPVHFDTAATGLYHGGVLRFSSGHLDAEAAVSLWAEALRNAAKDGLAALARGDGMAPDVEAVPNAPIEVFRAYDIGTKEVIVLWRIACRVRGEQTH